VKGGADVRKAAMNGMQSSERQKLSFDNRRFLVVSFITAQVKHRERTTNVSSTTMEALARFMDNKSKMDEKKMELEERRLALQEERMKLEREKFDADQQRLKTMMQDLVSKHKD
jgi:hypothetical protein